MLAYERRSTSVLRNVWQLECLRGHVLACLLPLDVGVYKILAKLRSAVS
jgi:hypothetical protein